MSYNRFDHEQSIMSCWCICEDLATLNEAVMEKDLTKDQICNILTGLHELYQIKFDNLFNNFEKSLKES